MAKGFFTQGAVILMDSVPPMRAVRETLKAFNVEGIRANEESGWMSGPETLSVLFRPEARGRILIDAFSRPWPDGMGDPQAAPELFSAWSMGFLGPHTFPGNLERAVQQSFAWEEAGQVVPRHTGFLRILSTYGMGAGDDDPLFPPNYDPLPELETVTTAAHWLLTLPGALAYFNPGGETLHSRRSLEQASGHARAQKAPPLDVWTNVRLFDAGDGWTVMDTVGMEQLGRSDHEACFPRTLADGSSVAGFLRNLSMYSLRGGSEVADGDTVDGPGGRWQARHCQEPLVSPPRDTLRWFPAQGAVPPLSLMPR